MTKLTTLTIQIIFMNLYGNLTIFYNFIHIIRQNKILNLKAAKYALQYNYNMNSK